MRLFHARTRRGLARLLERDRIFLGVWVATVGAIELVARRVPTDSDTLDLIGVTVLASLAAITWLGHLKRPISFVERLVAGLRAIAARVERGSVRYGFDLREEPPLQRGFPRRFELVMVAALVALFGLVLARDFLPGGLRELGMTVSPTLWYAFVGVLWFVLGVGSLALFFHPLDELQDRLNRRWGSLVERFVPLILVAHVLGLVTLAGSVPVWVPLAILAALSVTLITCLALPGNPRLAIVWRSRDDAAGDVRTCNWTRFVNAPLCVTICVLLGLLIVACGAQLTARPAVTRTVVTEMLGRLFAWALCASSVTFVLTRGAPFLLARWRDPRARGPRSLVHLDGVPAGRRREWRRRLAACGVRASFGARRDPTAVPVEVAETRRPASFFASPLERLALADLEDARTLERLHRRHEILCRRRFLRGLERVFKGVAGLDFEEPGGFWVAPDRWFVDSLLRDSGGEHSGWVGPTFSRTIPLAARRHLGRVLAALEVDAIYVEDGVTFRRFKRVFTTLFETFDIHGGSRRVEDVHFTGLPGLRVTLVETELDEPYAGPDGYPEPDFQDLGRARILMVHRDRGGDATPYDLPRASDRVPDALPVLI